MGNMEMAQGMAQFGMGQQMNMMGGMGGMGMGGMGMGMGGFY